MTNRFEARVTLTHGDLYRRVHLKHDETMIQMTFYSASVLEAFAHEMAVLAQGVQDYIEANPGAPLELEDLDGISG